MRRKILSFMGALILATAVNSRAQDDTDSAVRYDLGEVIVSATKSETYQAETGSSTTVITSRDLEKSGKTTVLEALRDVPGVTVMQSGAFGGSTSVYLRGAKPGHTLVMIDGVEMNDPMATDRSFDFANLMTDNIGRIEVVRGAQSTLYGSDAMGGVINIITKKGKGKPKWEASFEGGSHNTFKEMLGFSGSQDKLNYAFSLSRLDSKGISKAVDGSEHDGYENTTFSTRLGYGVLEDANLDLVFRLIDAKQDVDDGAYDDDPNNTARWKNITGKIAFEQAVNPIWDHKLSFSYSGTERKYKDEPDSLDTTDNTHNWYNGDTKKIEWQHNLHPLDWLTATAGFEYEKERGFSDGISSGFSTRFDRETMDSKGYYLQSQFKPLESLFITPGLRMDDNEFFGNKTTYKISGSYLMKTGMRLKANWGTSFKAPSLFQLYSSYGNLNLEPDEGKSYDFGFEQNLFNDKVFFGLTYFHNDFKNMVDFDLDSTSPTYYKYINVGRAATRGVEFEAKFLLPGNLKLGANYTYTKTEDKDTGLELAKRAKNQVGFNLNWAFSKKGNLNLSTSYVGHRWNDTTNTIKNKPYTRVDIYASYDLTEALKAFARIENLFDKRYEEVHGYANPGISFYAGAAASF